MGTHPSIRRTYPLGETLVIDRAVAWDDRLGMHRLHARRRAAQPTAEQIAVHQRLQQLRDAIERGQPEPIVRWSREGLIGRLIRLRRRLRRGFGGQVRIHIQGSLH